MKLFYYGLGVVSLILGLFSLWTMIQDGTFPPSEEAPGSDFEAGQMLGELCGPFVFLGGGFYLLISTANKESEK
jgi:hypothetical protein